MADDQGWDPVVARDWWGRVVFGKTFIEARSHLMVFRCSKTISYSLM